MSMPDLRALLIGAAVVAVVLFVARSSSDTEPPADTEPPTATQTAEETPAETPSPSSRCLDVPGHMQATIEEELIDVDGSYRVTPARAVRSSEFDRAHFVSTMLHASGMGGGEILTWLVAGELESPNMWLSADRMTEEFSPTPYAGSTDVGYVRSADGYTEARRCVGGPGFRD